ncbi:hypothetical protein PYCC9005_000817 [Savitreella phatthalungensis]
MANALIIVDVQYDFLGDGPLAVPDGESVIPVINRLLSSVNWDVVVATQDWHPPGHVSFASAHPGKQPFKDTVQVSHNDTTIDQALWPDHCIQHTRGAEFHASLSLPSTTEIVRKGYHVERDSYSALVDAFGVEKTRLQGLLDDEGVRKVAVVGLADDFCVFHTAIDASRIGGYKTVVIQEAVRGIKPWTQTSQDEFDQAGVRRIKLTDLQAFLDE